MHDQPASCVQDVQKSHVRDENSRPHVVVRTVAFQRETKKKDGEKNAGNFQSHACLDSVRVRDDP